MINRIINKINKIILISKINNRYNCGISYSVNLDILSIFEGRNKINHKTTIINSEIGFASYISANCNFPKTKIGRYCSIGPNVKIIVGNHPTMKYISTHPIFYSNKDYCGLSFDHNNVFKEFSYTDESENFLCEIGNDVWVGEDVRIINGVCIGDGAVIAAGAVVSKNVPPYAIVGGVPAKLIRYRFTEDEIAILLELKWWNKGEKWLKNNAKFFSDIEKIKMMYGESDEFFK